MLSNHFAAMTIDEYLKSTSTTQAQLGERIGRDQSTVSKLIKGKYNPSMSLLRRIAAATNGAVTPNDFLLPAAASNDREAAE
jgi:transcriptional regulator with XRE-family HTH domain